MRVSRSIAGIAAAVGMAVLPLTSAAAGTGFGGVGASVGVNGTNRVVASGNYTGQLLGTNQLLIEFECNAESIGVAASTAITSCTLHAANGSVSAQNVALPGNAAATAGIATVPLAPVKLCWSAVGTFVVGGTTVSSSGCTLDV
ncbi:MAG TPA: hypothetical protein VG318_11295 [Actinomycetota bacterium]|nr:hypothetical protein [Actinomycetota bacterium]